MPGFSSDEESDGVVAPNLPLPPAAPLAVPPAEETSKEFRDRSRTILGIISISNLDSKRLVMNTTACGGDVVVVVVLCWL